VWIDLISGVLGSEPVGLNRRAGEPSWQAWSRPRFAKEARYYQREGTGTGNPASGHV